MYTFYLMYINFLQFAYNDGLNINYAGYDLYSLPLKEIRSSNRIVISFGCVLGVITYVISSAIFINEKAVIFKYLAINIPLMFVFCIITSTILAINKSTQYNMLNLILKVFTTLSILFFILVRLVNVKTLLFADTLIRFLVVIFALIINRSIFFGERSNYKDSLRFIYKTCASGISVLLIIVISSLLLTWSRVLIEYSGTISQYAIYSFGISLVSIIITFANTLGLVIFPMIKLIDNSKFKSLFVNLKVLIENMCYIAFMLILPATYFIKGFLPNYSEITEYILYLVLWCFALTKINLIIMPLYKSYRKEKKLLKYLFNGLLIIICVTIPSYTLIQQAKTIAVVVFVLLLGLEMFTENKLAKVVDAKISHVGSILTICVYIVTFELFDVVIATIIYMVYYFVYFLINRKTIFSAIREIKNCKS